MPFMYNIVNNTGLITYSYTDDCLDEDLARLVPMYRFIGPPIQNQVASQLRWTIIKCPQVIHGRYDLLVFTGKSKSAPNQNDDSNQITYYHVSDLMLPTNGSTSSSRQQIPFRTQSIFMNMVLNPRSR